MFFMWIILRKGLLQKLAKNIKTADWAITDNRRDFIKLKDKNFNSSVRWHTETKNDVGYLRLLNRG